MSSVSWRDFRASLARNLNRRCSRLERARRSFRLIRSPLFAYGDAPLGRRSARSPTALQAACPNPRLDMQNPGYPQGASGILWSKWRDSNPRPFGPEPLTQIQRLFTHMVYKYLLTQLIHDTNRTEFFYNMRPVSDIIYFLIQTDTNIYLLTHNVIPRPDCFDLRRCAGLRLSRCPFPLCSRATQGGNRSRSSWPGAGCIESQREI